MIFLSESDMKQAIDMKDTIDALESAFKLHSRGQAVTPLRTHIDLEEVNGIALFMPSWAAPEMAVGVKTVTVYPENAQKGLPVIQGTMQLFSGETGAPVSLLEASYITKLRTGASSGVATRQLAPEGVVTAAIIGAGAQSYMQVWAVLTAAPTVKKYLIFDTYEERAEALKEQLQADFGSVEFAVTGSAAKAVKEAQVITTVTTSKTPVFAFADLQQKEVHINAVGAFKPEMQEIETKLMQQADKLYVDDLSGALEESGDLIIPINSGQLKKEDITGEIGEVLTGDKKGRERNDSLTIYETVGMGLLDLVTAKAIYEKALEQKIGTRLSLQ